MKELLAEARSCRICESVLPLGANPIVSAHQNSKIILISQAPGRVVHRSGIAWKDQSGNTLRQWLAVDEECFYRPGNFAVMPMGFCYPGKAKSGDLPPRPECAPIWHDRILSEIQGEPLVLLIGQYAQRAYLGSSVKKTLTETVQNYDYYLPKYFPLPHPSPLNNVWRKRNPWFEEGVVPVLSKIISERLNC